MSKKLLSANEIQQESQNRINSVREIVDDGAKITAPVPYLHAEDENGTNWSIGTIGNATGYMPQIRAVIENLRHEVNLRP